MRPAGLDERKDGHEEREAGERAVAEDRLDRERFGSGETTAIDLQA